MERDTVQLHRLAQHADHATVVDLRRHMLGHLRPRDSLTTQPRHQLLPRGRLRLLHERQQLVREQAKVAVVPRGGDLAPPVRQQVHLDARLERLLRVHAGHGARVPAAT
ncbi:hypothetical protein [Cellulomonas soli]